MNAGAPLPVPDDTTPAAPSTDTPQAEAAESAVTESEVTESATEPDAAAEVTAAAAAATRTPVLPSRLVFRVPGTAYVAVLFFVLCASSVALVSRWFALIYLIPLALAFWILRTRTEVDADRLVVRRVLAAPRSPWSAVKSLRLSEKGWVRAVRTDGAARSRCRRCAPASARTGLISGGRITDPTADQGPV